MSEMAQTADRLVIVGRGNLLADTTVADMVAEASAGGIVLVRAPRAQSLAEALDQPSVQSRAEDPDPSPDITPNPLLETAR